jgi:hypothetical protein
LIVQVTREELLKRLGYKQPPPAKLLNMAHKMLGLLEGLLEPTQGFKPIQDERDLPPFLQGAVLKYAGAITLGPNLENKVKALFEEGKPAEAFLLDTAGSIAITKAGDILWDEIREHAAAKGFRKGLRRTPGCRGIDLETQGWIFGKLADLDLGIELTSSFMMSPQKSLSFLARFGGKLRGIYPCEDCPQYSTCSLKGLTCTPS